MACDNEITFRLLATHNIKVVKEGFLLFKLTKLIDQWSH